MEIAGCEQRVFTRPVRLVDPLADNADWRLDDIYPRQPHAAIFAVGESTPLWHSLLPGIAWGCLVLAVIGLAATGLVLATIAIIQRLSDLAY